MTHSAVMEMLEETGLPYAYDHFDPGASPPPPFAVFLYPESDNFIADGKVWKKLARLHIELYTDRKDPPLEKKTEDVLDAHDLAYQKSETWIASEKMFEVLYVTEIFMEEDGELSGDGDVSEAADGDVSRTVGGTVSGTVSGDVSEAADGAVDEAGEGTEEEEKDG